MSNLPPETKALHREVYAGLIAFVVGFFVTLAALEWLLVRLVDPDTRWWQILHFSISATIISVIGGLALAVILRVKIPHLFAGSKSPTPETVVS